MASGGDPEHDPAKNPHYTVISSQGGVFLVVRETILEIQKKDQRSRVAVAASVLADEEIRRFAAMVALFGLRETADRDFLRGETPPARDPSDPGPAEEPQGGAARSVPGAQSVGGVANAGG